MQDPIEYIKKYCDNQWPTEDHDFYPSGWYLSNDGMSIMVRYVNGGADVILKKDQWLRLQT